MAKVTGAFAPDTELSEIISKLWDLDDNKCSSPDDFAINLQVKDYSGILESRGEGCL